SNSAVVLVALIHSTAVLGVGTLLLPHPLRSHSVGQSQAKGILTHPVDLRPHDSSGSPTFDKAQDILKRAVAIFLRVAHNLAVNRRGDNAGSSPCRSCKLGKPFAKWIRGVYVRRGPLSSHVHHSSFAVRARSGLDLRRHSRTLPFHKQDEIRLSPLTP